jgi:hypothetical protein
MISDHDATVAIVVVMIPPVMRASLVFVEPDARAVVSVAVIVAVAAHVHAEPADSESLSMALARNYPMCEKAKMLDRDRTSYSFKAAFGAYTQAHSILKSNPRISFSSSFDFLSFHTAWAISGLMHSSKCVLFDHLVGGGNGGAELR